MNIYLYVKFFLGKMVRIRQTARMSTGGKQPRRRLVQAFNGKLEQEQPPSLKFMDREQEAFNVKREQTVKSEYVDLKIQIPQMIPSTIFKMEDDTNKRQKFLKK